LQKVRQSTPHAVHIEISESGIEMAGERLLRAVLSFYREEADDLARLEPLLSCRLSRGWSALRIDCTDRLHLEQVNELIPLLRAPLDALQLVRQIRLMAPGVPDRIYPVRVPQLHDGQASTAE
tara:strand:- start:398 stop:766 length:369 start_codon:yes stop_codon:yes gene_type:complete